MTRSTPEYGLAIFDWGDDLTSQFNVEKEIERFLIIDRQLFGLYSIFGNGVISGWDIYDNGYTQETGISISVSTGVGIIKLYSCQTETPIVLSFLSPNSFFFVYATITDSPDIRDRTVAFATTAARSVPQDSILIGTVTTGDTSVTSVDNSTKVYISFEEIINEKIAAHKHRGTPSKIDLMSEVKNQLSGARIESLDAEKIVSGILEKERIPVIDHNDLDNIGTITHAGIETFLKTFSQNNKELLGEIATVNLLKSIIFQKYKFVESDKDYVNTLVLIPGITPSSFIDFSASTATVNEYNGTISGNTPSIGTFTSKIWNNSTSFATANKQTNITISNDEVYLSNNAATIIMLESFEGVGSSGQSVPNYSISIDNSNDQNSITLNEDPTYKLDNAGFFSGKFSVGSDYDVIYTKTFVQPQDLSSCDVLVFSIKTISVSHPAIYAYFVNGAGDTAVLSDPMLLLAADKITSNIDMNQNSFEEIEVDISNYAKDDVRQLVIYTQDKGDNFTFYLDEIYAKIGSVFYPQGSIIFRHSTGVPVNFYSISYDNVLPDSTELRVRARVANDSNLLSRSSFSLPLSSGDVLSLTGTDIEIEVIFLTDDSAKTPVLTSLELQMVASSDSNGFTIDDILAWNNGTKENITIDPYSEIARLSNPIGVGDIVFSTTSMVNEVDNTKFPITGISGDNLPISPSQSINYSNNIANGLATNGFNGVVFAERTISKNFIIADRDNDRIMEIDSSGNVIIGFGSVYIQDTDFYVFSANYNKVSNILSIILSRPILTTDVTLSSIVLIIGTSKISLDINDTILISNKNKQILEIQLSDIKKNMLANVNNNVYLQFKSGAFAEDLSTENVNEKIIIGLQGLPVSLCNFTYIDGIRHPVSVRKQDDGNFAVCNSSIMPSSSSTSKYSSFIILNTQTGLIDYSYGQILFSDYSLGSSWQLDNSKIVLGGVVKQTDEEISKMIESNSGRRIEIDIDLGSTLANIELYAEIYDSGSQIIGKAITEGFTNLGGGKYKWIYNLFPTNGTTVKFFNSSNKSQVSNTVNVVESMFTTGQSTIVSVGATTREAFVSDATLAMQTYKGICVIVDKSTSSIVFQYNSPDGLYVSDVMVDESGILCIAESGFGSSGRIIKLDSFGNIMWKFGERNYKNINHIRFMTNGNFLISI